MEPPLANATLARMKAVMTAAIIAVAEKHPKRLFKVDVLLLQQSGVI
jgi:hypothetical protein